MPKKYFNKNQRNC